MLEEQDANLAEIIEFRVIDKDTRNIVGYVFFNTTMSDGSYYLNVNDIDAEDKSPMVHTDWNGVMKLRPSHPMGTLIYEQYLNITDNDGNKVYTSQPAQLIDETMDAASCIITDLISYGRLKTATIILLSISIIYLLLK